ncbi:hypothetical protein N866_10880 [Actinotalea ferrariae CF5-4]|uniref:MarR family transcriptional regulator n=1 Tax=Actinotalea ferrariae CF5-4 TaxID=948458 RepID=A0A021VZE6_9CELL|nr:hypothetical protein [Actinotalea ferrariae]EYR64437.1 hypothetical protein N866_10880 [Actinotalea ferrariae CF5-4]
MFVITADQQGSRRVGDRVDDLLARLAAWQEGRAGVVRGFERTVGDEVQCVLEDADAAVDVALLLLRWGGWSVGIGAGPVDQPLPEHARAGSGPAFVLARSAVEKAKTRGRPVPLAVDGTVPHEADDAEAVLTLLGVLRERRTTSGWEAVDALTAAGATATQERVAEDLGITQQAVSQRLRTALWAEEQAARPAAARLLRRAQGPHHQGAGA